MPLFWNNNFNQGQNFMQGNFNFQRQNNLQNNRQMNGSLFSRLFFNRQNQGFPIQNGFNSNIQNNNQPFMPQNQMPLQQMQPSQQILQDNPEISFKPLTEEELTKINEEIKENIEKNQKEILPINLIQDNDNILNYLKEFIQDERNGNIFYTSLANNCNNDYHRDRLKSIGEECNIETNSLKQYYRDLQNEDFEPENLPININMSLKQGLFLAMEEEIKSYNKICNMLDKIPYEQTKNFYKMALKKLSRINSIQYMAMDKNI